MVDAGTWCGKALSSIFTLWRHEENFARRHSSDIDVDYRPTATFHAIIALGECGIWEPDAKLKDGELVTPYIEVPDVGSCPAPREVLRALVMPAANEKQAGAVEISSQSWVELRIKASSHTRVSSSHKRDETHPTFQQALVIGGLFQALRVLLTAGAVKFADDSTVDASPNGGSSNEDHIAERVREGIAEATELLLQLVSTIEPDARGGGEHARVMTEAELSESEEVSTNLLLHLAIALIERKRIIAGAPQWGLAANADTDETQQRLEAVERSLTGYFRREVDRLMARRNVATDPQYDPTSLAFAMRGLTLFDEDARSTALFRAGVDAVVGGQHPDGCWPDGVSVTYRDDGSTIQQPSVEVALSLADSVYHDELLMNHDRPQIEAVESALKALNKSAEYLAASFVMSNDDFSGWVSDRTRCPGLCETWITAYAARLFYRIFLAERACRRASTLHKYLVRTPKNMNRITATDGDRCERHKVLACIECRWSTKVTEPDAILKPADELLRKVLKPLEEQRLRDRSICRPQKGGVSFVIFGPPGSGKTFMVEQLAETLGWPLLALNPGHFIHDGLELIESRAAKIFDDLMNLDHAVVFFDECDELFRERSSQGSEGRNILSFATASMLPKLQELHDARRVIFFLGTNYLRHVDTAVRRSGRFDGRLLFDRPDIAAREQLLSVGWSTIPEDLKKEAAEYTRGWMNKDVIDLASDLKDAIGDGAAPNDPLRHVDAQGSATVPDYKEWCVRDGKPELEAASVAESRRWAVLARWDEFPDFRDAYCKHQQKCGGEKALEEAVAFFNELDKYKRDSGRVK